MPKGNTEFTKSILEEEKGDFWSALRISPEEIEEEKKNIEEMAFDEEKWKIKY